MLVVVVVVVVVVVKAFCCSVIVDTGGAAAGAVVVLLLPPLSSSVLLRVAWQRVVDALVLTTCNMNFNVSSNGMVPTTSIPTATPKDSDSYG